MAQRCPDCIRRLAISEDEDPETALLLHRTSGDCRAVPSPGPKQTKHKPLPNPVFDSVPY